MRHRNYFKVTVQIAALMFAIAAPSFADLYETDDAVSADALSNPFEFSSPKPVNNYFDRKGSTDGAVSIDTDNAGTWIAVWESNRNLKGKAGTDWDIFYSVSTNKGKTWSDPQWLNTNAKTDTGNDRKPTIIRNKDGSNSLWFVGWHTNDSLGNTIGTDNDVVWSKSSDNGATWTDPAPIDANATADTGSDINVDMTWEAGDDFVAVWQSNDSRGNTIGTDWDILCGDTSAGATETGTWPRVLIVNDDATTDNRQDRHPKCAPLDTPWIIVWERKISNSDYDIFYSTNGSDNNVAWSARTDISNSSDQSRRPSIGYWRTGTGANQLLHVVLAWDNKGSSGSDRDIAVTNAPYAIFDTVLNWSTPQLLNRNANEDSKNDSWVHIETDGLGRWLAVWESKEDLKGAGGDPDIFWARSTNNGAGWSFPRTVNNNANTDSGGDRRPEAVADNNGKWLVLWKSNHNFGGVAGTDNDIYGVRTTNNLSGPPALTYP